SGQLEREQPKRILGAQGSLSSRIGFFHTYRRNTSGIITFYFFCATQTTLYLYNGSSWAPVPDVGTLADFPVARNINNQMHLSDGTVSWLFDGTNWITDGLAIPLHSPSISVGTPGASVTVSSISRVNGVVTVTLSGIPQITGSLGTFGIGPGNYIT